MDTKAAILSLRKRLGITQDEFAKRLGLTVTSVSRYENGSRPSDDVLQKLAGVASEENLQGLAETFTSIRKSSIAERVRNLPASGAQRPVSLRELKYWSACLHEMSTTVLKIASATSQWKDRRRAEEELRDAVRGAAQVMGSVRDRVELWVDEPYSGARIEEDREILRWGHDRFRRGETTDED